MEKREKLLIVISSFVLIVLVGVVSYAFMRYLNVGNDNAFTLGDVAFSSSYTAQNKNTVFPIPASAIGTDNNNTAKVTVSIQGTSHYATGMNYRVILDDFDNDLGGNMEGPVSIVVSSNNLSGVTLHNYDTKVFGHTGDVIASGTIPAGTSVNGTITVTAFVNSDLVVISDNYYNQTGSPRKVIFGTNDWDTFATQTGLTFRIRVEAETVVPPEPYVTPVRACTYDGTLEKGATFTDGQYTYKYLQESYAWYEDNTFYDEWYDLDVGLDGWGVKVTNRNATTDITTELCTTINDKPIVSMRSMFTKSKAKYVDTSSFDTSNVTSMNSMFAYSDIEEADLSHFDTSNVDNFSSMFYEAKFEILDLSTWDTSSATDMSCMFEYAEATSINVSSFDTSNVTNMYYMFYDTKVEFLDLRNFDTSKVTNMAYMFGLYENHDLKKFYISNFDTSSVIVMQGMFYGLDVDRLYLHGLDTSNVTNMSYMFYGVKVPKIDLNSFDTSNLETIEGMFYYSLIGNINVKHFDTSNVENFKRLFREAYYEGDLDLSSWNTNSVINMDEVFYASNIGSLDLSGWSTSYVTTMEYMFYYVILLDDGSLNLTSFDTSSVTDMDSMFEKCEVTTVYVSDTWTTSVVTSSTNMFKDAINLVGGAGTTYTSGNPKDKTYARVDNKPNEPGYFTYRRY